MTGFVQLFEFGTSDIEDLTNALAQSRADNPGVMTAIVTRITEDRDRPGTYIAINEFESYERDGAVEPPAHNAVAELMAENVVGRQFRNLDVRSELSGR